jgi:outer membrane protein OmpA-like peptidoglycan-associated protein
MSRSSNFRTGDGRSRRSALGAVLGLLLVVGTAAQPGVAVADATAPVLPIVAPVVDIRFGVADLKNEVRVETLPKTTTITLDSTVLFGKNSAKINARANGRLRDVARQLKARGPGSVRITGYTDDLGSAASGETLSRQRAAAGAKVLRRDLPASSFRFTLVGKGEADPAVPNKNEANRKINRRVVLVYEKKS